MVHFQSRHGEVLPKIDAEFGKAISVGVDFRGNFLKEVITLVFVLFNSLPNVTSAARRLQLRGSWSFEISALPSRDRAWEREAIVSTRANRILSLLRRALQPVDEVSEGLGEKRQV
jgi:hypothetical protein